MIIEYLLIVLIKFTTKVNNDVLLYNKQNNNYKYV